ncbi:MAG: HEPN domain-containing protein [Duncaniella sp.]|nr:HEPN domain-containing protein [Duncaniella sp.]
MTLSPEDRQAVIDYRIERSLAAFKEAQYVAKGYFWNLTANRLYYAVFYMCEALLLSNQITTSSHAGVSRMMSLHFVRTGKLQKEEGELLGRLFRMRQTGDYDDLSDWTEDEIMPLFPKVEELIHKIKSLV